jgi:predicted nucleic acid-binding protein
MILLDTNVVSEAMTRDTSAFKATGLAAAVKSHENPTCHVRFS